MKRELDDWIDAYMLYTFNSEPPDLFKKWVAISVVASCLQRKCKLEWGHLTFYPNMYIVLVAPSGVCRKGTAMAPGYKILDKQGIDMSSQSITREALIKELNEVSAIDIAGGIAPTSHASITIFSEELTVFLGWGNLQLMTDLTDWYDCKDRWKYRTKQSGTDNIQGVWVNLIGATTPALIQSALPSDAIGGGLTSRMIFVYEEKKGKIVPHPFITEEEMEIHKKMELDIGQINNMKGNFTVTKEWVERYTEWYMEQHSKRPFKDERLGGYTQRRPIHVIKLSMIMCASRKHDGDMTIDKIDIDNAISTLEQTEINMPKTFGGYGRDPMSDVTHKVMEEIAIQDSISFKDLLDIFKMDVDIRKLNDMVSLLDKVGYCKRVIEGTNEIIRYVKK